MNAAAAKKLMRHIVERCVFIKRLAVTMEDGRVLDGTLYCDVTEDDLVLPIFKDTATPPRTENVHLSLVAKVEVTHFGWEETKTF